ncbi:MAG: hypothetical protein AB7G25_06740 [Sphingomonadaceae bacterium]
MTCYSLIDTAEAKKISAIAALLGSNHSGEILAAANMLSKALAKHNLRIGEVVERGLAPPQLPPPPPRPQWTATPPAYDPATLHKFKAGQCLSNINRFNAKERDFLREMRAVRRPSPKQRDWLDRLHARIVEDF